MHNWYLLSLSAFFRLYDITINCVCVCVCERRSHAIVQGDMEIVHTFFLFSFTLFSIHFCILVMNTN
jgi:hypothetical protein